MALLKHRKETFVNWIDLVINDNTDSDTEYTLTHESRIVGRAIGKEIISGGSYLIGSGSTLTIPSEIFSKTLLKFKGVSNGYARIENTYFTASVEGEICNGINPFLTHGFSFGSSFGAPLVFISAALSKENFISSAQSVIGSSTVDARITFNSTPTNNQTFTLTTEQSSASDMGMRSYIFISA